MTKGQLNRQRWAVNQKRLAFKAFALEHTPEKYDEEMRTKLQQLRELSTMLSSFPHMKEQQKEVDRQINQLEERLIK